MKQAAAKPFVEVGSKVAAGDKLFLVEAMKTFNDVVAHKGGTVSQVFVEDGQPVEFGQPALGIFALPLKIALFLRQRFFAFA